MLEVRRDLSEGAAIDQQRLRIAVEDDLLRDRLLEWLETNNTVTEKIVTADSAEMAEAAEAEAETPTNPDNAKKASKDKGKDKVKGKDKDKAGKGKH